MMTLCNVVRSIKTNKYTEKQANAIRLKNAVTDTSSRQQKHFLYLFYRIFLMENKRQYWNR